MSYDSPPAADPGRKDSLPTVEPPTAGFILQLFLIPLLIVSIVIALWLLFSWLAHAGQNDPQSVLGDLRKMGTNSFQRAHELATMLQEQSEQGEKLRNDPAFAKQVSDVLLQDIQVYPGEITNSRAKTRLFLCGALAEFEIPDVVPTLIQVLNHTGEEGAPSTHPAITGGPVLGAEKEFAVHNVQVRIGAAESLAKLSSKLGKEELRELPDVVPSLIAASRIDPAAQAADEAAADELAEEYPTMKSGYRPHAELRAVCTFALGVIGGKEAQDRLLVIAEQDPYANARYNAATGLARYGDERVIGTLLDMLNPENTAPSENEWHDSERQQALVNVLKAGMQASLRLAETNPSLDLSKIKDAILQLRDSDLSMIKDAGSRRLITLSATETLRLIDEAQAGESK